MPTVKLRIGPADDGRAITLEEFRDAEEESGYRYELARGVLEVGEVPGDEHGQIVDNLHEGFSNFRRGHPGLIRRIAHGSDLRVIIPELESDRHPDLALVFFGARLNSRGRQIPGLVYEVVSPGTRARRRDYQQKAEEFLTLGIGEYWIVDPKNRIVTILELRTDGGAPAWSERVFKGDEVIISTLLAGFEGTVSQLWIDAASDEPEASANGS
jgi:Uma2 family endonuclease